jgi:hypothetical protein
VGWPTGSSTRRKTHRSGACRFIPDPRTTISLWLPTFLEYGMISGFGFRSGNAFSTLLIEDVTFVNGLTIQVQLRLGCGVRRSLSC